MATKTSIPPRRKPSNGGVSNELKHLKNESVAGLRNRFKALFGRDPPTALGADLLRRSIAHRIQSNTHGDLSLKNQRAIDLAIKAAAKKPNGELEIPRRIKPGSELIREWKDKTYRIVVTPKGFSYDGKEYVSLSEIASHITGTNWNGPRFFGLRSKTTEATVDGK